MTDEVLVRAEHICKYFKIGGGRMLHAVEDLNLDIHRLIRPVRAKTHTLRPQHIDGP